MTMTTTSPPLSDRHKLLWSQPSNPPPPPSLPTGITRTFIPTTLGALEILIAQPTSPSGPSNRKPALLFIHGGFGSANVWVPYLSYFSSRGFPCYALSLRGHGASWKPGFLRMVWGYGKVDFAADLEAGIGFVRGLEEGLRVDEGGFGDEDLVLLGHSAGGGLVQFYLGRGTVKVGGMVIIASFPCFGGLAVYWNWFKMDPWFVPRYYIRDLFHSRSPLSSTTLVHNAFFSPAYPRSEVRAFEAHIPEYESMIWPFGMMFSFVNVPRVVRNIVGWGDGGKRILVVAGERDRLMGTSLMGRMAGIYRRALEGWYTELGVKEGGEDGGVGFEVVSDSGHHLQNDVNWEEGAEKIEKFLEQL